MNLKPNQKTNKNYIIFCIMSCNILYDLIIKIRFQIDYLKYDCYSCSLWQKYSSHPSNALRVQYNNAFRILIDLPHHCSATGIFMEGRVDGFHAVIRKRCASLLGRLRTSPNNILNVLVSLGLTTALALCGSTRAAGNIEFFILVDNINFL